MNKYLFEVVLEKTDHVTIEAENYEEAEDLLAEGDYPDKNMETININFTDCKCIKKEEVNGS